MICRNRDPQSQTRQRRPIYLPWEAPDGFFHHAWFELRKRKLALFAVCALILLYSIGILGTGGGDSRLLGDESSQTASCSRCRKLVRHRSIGARYLFESGLGHPDYGYFDIGHNVDCERNFGIDIRNGGWLSARHRRHTYFEDWRGNRCPSRMSYCC